MERHTLPSVEVGRKPRVRVDASGHRWVWFAGSWIPATFHRWFFYAAGLLFLLGLWNVSSQRQPAEPDSAAAVSQDFLRRLPPTGAIDSLEGEVRAGQGSVWLPPLCMPRTWSLHRTSMHTGGDEMGPALVGPGRFPLEPQVVRPAPAVAEELGDAVTAERADTADEASPPVSEPIPTESWPRKSVAAADGEAGEPAIGNAWPRSAAVAEPVELASRASRLPRVESVERSAQVELLAQEADRHSRRAYELAGRNAYFASRSEFVAALRLVAQALDADQPAQPHGKALAAGLAALTEADDFLPSAGRVEADLDIRSLVAAHRTPVLKAAPSEQLNALAATRVYFTYAQEQLAFAAGREVAGSMALHGLGKVYTAMGLQAGAAVKLAETKAVTLYQAALLVHPQNFMAANDLGVLLARCGRLPEARAMLEHSLSVQPQAVGWKNLARVYRGLGDVDRSMRAEALANRSMPASAARDPAAAAVRWVDAGAFNQMYAQSLDAQQALPARGAQPATAQNAPLGANRK